MIPMAPALNVRPLAPDDLAAVLELVNHWLSAAAYSLPMDRPSAHQLFFGNAGASHYEARYSEHCRLGAWRSGELVGFADIATGHDHGHLDEPEYPPFGLLRFLALTEREGLAEEVFGLLMEKSEQFWRNEGASHLVAYHVSTGYPAFQAGAGVLPGEWSGQVRLLTAADWRFSERFYALVRPTSAPLEEECPLADLSLAQQRSAGGRTYRVYHRRVVPVASAKVVGMNLDRTGTVERVAHVLDLEVNELWRNRNLGRWLLRRLLNDTALQGFQEVIAFLPMSLPIARNLFVQHGFQEINYRGYTFEKTLAPLPAR